MAQWLRRLLLLLFGAAVVGGIVYAFLPKPVPVDLTQVARGPLRVTIDEDGRTRIKERYVVSSPLSGRLRRIRLRAGDKVVAGETLLAVIEPTDPALLDARTRAEAEARVKAAQAAVERTKPQLESALAAMQHAESELARLRKVRTRGAITEQELEQAELAERLRTQEYKAARFAEDIARFELEQAEAALLRTQPDSDENEYHFEIQSPITGRVLRVFQESATVVAAGQELLEVGDPTDLEVEIDVLSSDGVKIKPGDPVLLEEWGGEKPLPGVVRLVEPSAFTKISALGVEEQRVNVIVDLTAPPEERPQLGDAYRVEARIIIWEESNVLKVPTSALFRVGNDWAVFRAENGRAITQTVTLGQQNGLEAEILAGLQEGQTVILHPGDTIQNGTSIVPR